jgi:hypothetical protein
MKEVVIAEWHRKFYYATHNGNGNSILQRCVLDRVAELGLICVCAAPFRTRQQSGYLK